LKLDVGCGLVPKPGHVGVDLHRGGADVLADISHLPFRNGSIEEIHASHVVEHVLDLRALMLEFHRVLREDGILNVIVPYGLRSLYDPFHLHAFDMDTFRYFTRERGRDTNERSSQSVGLFDLDECRIDTISQFTKFIPRLAHACENGSALGKVMRSTGSNHVFRLLPKGRWPQIVVRLRK